MYGGRPGAVGRLRGEQQVLVRIRAGGACWWRAQEQGLQAQATRQRRRAATAARRPQAATPRRAPEPRPQQRARQLELFPEAEGVPHARQSDGQLAVAQHNLAAGAGTGEQRHEVQRRGAAAAAGAGDGSGDSGCRQAAAAAAAHSGAASGRAQARMGGKSTAGVCRGGRGAPVPQWRATRAARPETPRPASHPGCAPPWPAACGEGRQRTNQASGPGASNTAPAQVRIPSRHRTARTTRHTHRQRSRPPQAAQAPPHEAPCSGPPPAHQE